jgi:hypothetical protein
MLTNNLISIFLLVKVDLEAAGYDDGMLHYGYLDSKPTLSATFQQGKRLMNE